MNNLSHLTPVYIDETGFETYFHRKYGRSLKGQLIKGKVSGRRYQRISLVAGLINGALIAPMTYKDTMTSGFFEAWFKTFLLPTLGKPSVIIMDNAKFHRMSKLKDLCEEQGHRLLPLPPYSPEYNPIEKIWAHIKNTSEEYCQIAILFLRHFRPALVSVDYKYRACYPGFPDQFMRYAGKNPRYYLPCLTLYNSIDIFIPFT